MLFVSPALAEVGVVLQVINGQIIRNGNSVEIDEGFLVEEGDVLTTESNGLIQVQLIDGTNFAVYADSTINIDTALIGSDENTFESLAVGITGGIFRLVSGDSDSEAYEISTPTATMGIRGTIVEYNYEEPFTYVLGTDQESTIRLNDASGRPIESSGVVNPGECNMFRVGPAGIEEIPQPNLRENMPSACHRQDIFLTGVRRGDSCSPEVLCDDFDPAFDNIEEILEEVEAINEELDPQSGEEELEDENELDEEEDGEEEDGEEEDGEEEDGEEEDGEEEQEEEQEEGSLNPESFPLFPLEPGETSPFTAPVPASVPSQGAAPTQQNFITQSSSPSFTGGGGSFGALGGFNSLSSTTTSSSSSSGTEDCVEPNSNTNKCENNGEGNGDQDAPGGSCENNSAENDDCVEEP